MPLYINTRTLGDGPPEIRRVIPGQGEDIRCGESPNWERITDEQLAELRAGLDAGEQLGDLVD